MRPRSSRLLLVGALPLAISGCGNSDPILPYSVKQSFKNVQSCVDAKFPVDLCSDAYIQAMTDHRRDAPSYADRAACDADFIEGYCQPASDGTFMPQMAGFELSVSGELPKSAVDQAQSQAQQQAALSGGGSAMAAAATGALVGMLVGNVMSNRAAPRFQSQPVYQSRDSRGSYQTSTLARQIEQGKTFNRSTQPQRYQSRRERNDASSGYSGSSGASRSGSSSTFRSSSSSSSVNSGLSRGGFGGQAAARSGWSGKSSGFGG